MVEYVTKEQVKEEILSWAKCITNPERIVTEDALYVIDVLPAADVRPVVLCKDCDLWNEWDSFGKESLGTYRCSCAEWTTEITTYYTGPDEFCSRGVRRDSDG